MPNSNEISQYLTDYTDKEQFEQTVELLLNKQLLPDLYEQLKFHIKEKYDINACNFFLEYFDEKKLKDPKYRLCIHAFGDSDYKKTYIKNEGVKKRKKTAEKFCKLFNEKHPLDMLREKEIFIYFTNFSDELRIKLGGQICYEMSSYFDEKYE